MINSSIRKSKTVLGHNIIEVLESFGKIEWAKCSPAIQEVNLFDEAEKNPHSTVWRWKNPDSQLDRLIVEAVNSFHGQIEWEISSRKRIPKLGGMNWVIQPRRKKQFFNEHKSLSLGEINRSIREKEPEVGILSNQDLPKLAEHIKRYVENRQTTKDAQYEKTKF